MTDENFYILPPDWHCVQVATPLSEAFDWSLDFLGIPDLWRQTRGKGVRVAILDTGIAPHPDLDGAVIAAKDFTGSLRGEHDVHSHGTWCAGMVGARAGNDIGVAGIAPECRLLIAKVLGDNGAGTDATIESGMRWAMDAGADIISMSLGGPQMGNRLHSLFIEFVTQPRKFIFCAAGNHGQQQGDSINYPAKWPESISVGAVDKQGKVTRFSSRGTRLDIMAPGQDMVSTIPTGYGAMSGTSMACPVAAGVGALALAKHLEHGGTSELLNTSQMKQHLRSTAIDKGVPGVDPEYGPGLIDPGKLLAGLAPPADDGLAMGPIVIHSPAKTGDLFSVGLR